MSEIAQQQPNILYKIC